MGLVKLLPQGDCSRSYYHVIYRFAHSSHSLRFPRHNRSSEFYNKQFLMNKKTPPEISFGGVLTSKFFE
jgi:hypothetical protein